MARETEQQAIDRLKRQIARSRREIERMDRSIARSHELADRVKRLEWARRIAFRAARIAEDARRREEQRIEAADAEIVLLWARIHGVEVQA